MYLLLTEALHTSITSNFALQKSRHTRALPLFLSVGCQLKQAGYKCDVIDIKVKPGFRYRTL